MFNSITGIVTWIGEDRVYLQTDSVEWSILIPSIITTQLHIDASYKIYLYLNHREDSMTLFGFISVKQRDLFLNLIKVNGIGPKQALKILSAATEEFLISAIDSDDVTVLAKIPGIGAKTAAKIILSLKGKLAKVPEGQKVSSYNDIVTALVDMGFGKKEVERVVSKLEKQYGSQLSGQALEDEIFRRAIVELSS